VVGRVREICGAGPEAVRKFWTRGQRVLLPAVHHLRITVALVGPRTFRLRRSLPRADTQSPTGRALLMTAVDVKCISQCWVGMVLQERTVVFGFHGIAPVGAHLRMSIPTGQALSSNVDCARFDFI
jgi:hypothetical protein